MKYNKDKYDLMPEGAISLEKIDHIYLTQILEEGGASDLIPVLATFSHGQILEDQGKLKEAGELYKGALKRVPKNEWMKEAALRVKYTLN